MEDQGFNKIIFQPVAKKQLFEMCPKIVLTDILVKFGLKTSVAENTRVAHGESRDRSAFYSCHLCTTKDLGKVAMSNHIASVHGCSCHICGKKVIGSKAFKLIKHFKRRHCDTSLTVGNSSPAQKSIAPSAGSSEPKQPAEAQDFTCEECNRKFQSLNEMARHMLAGHGQNSKRKIEDLGAFNVTEKRRKSSEMMSLTQKESTGVSIGTIIPSKEWEDEFRDDQSEITPAQSTTKSVADPLANLKFLINSGVSDGLEFGEITPVEHGKEPAINAHPNSQNTEPVMMRENNTRELLWKQLQEKALEKTKPQGTTQQIRTPWVTAESLSNPATVIDVTNQAVTTKTPILQENVSPTMSSNQSQAELHLSEVQLHVKASKTVTLSEELPSKLSKSTTIVDADKQITKTIMAALQERPLPKTAQSRDKPKPRTATITKEQLARPNQSAPVATTTTQVLPDRRLSIKQLLINSSTSKAETHQSERKPQQHATTAGVLIHNEANDVNHPLTTLTSVSKSNQQRLLSSTLQPLSTIVNHPNALPRQSKSSPSSESVSTSHSYKSLNQTYQMSSFDDQGHGAAIKQPVTSSSIPNTSIQDHNQPTNSLLPHSGQWYQIKALETSTIIAKNSQIQDAVIQSVKTNQATDASSLSAGNKKDVNKFRNHLLLRAIDSHKLLCKECKILVATSEAKSHLLTYHKEYVKLRLAQYQMKKESNTSTNKGLQEALKSYTPVQLKCLYCSYCTSDGTELSDHIVNQHRNRLMSSCKYCDYVSLYTEHMQQHVDTYHKWRYCDMCDFSTRNHVLLNDHVSSVHLGLV